MANPTRLMNFSAVNRYRIISNRGTFCADDAAVMRKAAIRGIAALYEIRVKTRSYSIMSKATRGCVIRLITQLLADVFNPLGER